MSGYDIAEWSDFGVGVSGATAALTGLLFVAVSLNLKEILAGPGLPRRAAATLIFFSTALMSGILLLIPGQSGTVLGTELCVLAVIVGIPLLWMQTRPPRTEYVSAFTWFMTHVVPSLLVPLLTLLAGIGLILDRFGGLYSLAAAIIVAITAGLVNAWVLLVEIQR